MGKILIQKISESSILRPIYIERRRMVTTEVVPREMVSSEVVPLRRTSFGGSFQRLSFDELQREAEVASLKKKNPTSDLETVDQNKNDRRRRSFEQLRASQLDGGTSSLLKEAICSAWGVDEARSPREKLDALLIRGKKRGLTAEKFFAYFDANEDGYLTAKEFKDGLMALDPVLFKMTDDELSVLIDIFDQNRDKRVNTSEFENYCYALNDASWKAEKIRRDNRKEHTKGKEEKEEKEATESPSIVSSTEAKEDKEEEEKTQAPPEEEKAENTHAKLTHDTHAKLTHSASLKALDAKAKRRASAEAKKKNIHKSTFKA